MSEQRILINTEYHITGLGLSEIIGMKLGSIPEISMVHSFDDVKKKLKIARFDMLVMEIKSDNQKNKQKLDAFLRFHNSTKILVMSDTTDFNFCRWLFKKGVLGVAHINSPVEEMGKAITKVYNGELYVDNNLLKQMIKLELETNSPAV